MNELDSPIPYVPYLCLKTADSVRYFQLDPDSNALVGVGGHCKIRLAGDDIRSLHCILAMKEDGLIEVRDWNTGSTYLNGTAISKPTMMAEDDLLRIGEYEITAVLCDDGRRPNVAAKNRLQSSKSTDEEEQFPDFWTRKERPLKSDLSAETSKQVAEEDPSTASEPVVDEQSVGEELTIPSTDEKPAVEEPALETESTVEVSVDAEELKNLRLEVAQLKSELARKDPSSETDSEFLSRAQSEQMVSQLQEMLAELKNSDVRSRELKELLHAAEQTNHDEQQERKKIENWMSELESRVDQRETEARTEVHQLKTLLQEARETQRKSNECMRGVISIKTGSGEPIPAELAYDLSKQIESLQSQLAAAHDEKERLRQQFLQRDAELATESVAQRKLAEMQLVVSRERAEISRQKAELAYLKADADQRNVAESTRTPASAGHDRVNAMDVHSRELNDEHPFVDAPQSGPEVLQEEPSSSKNQGAGIASRITSLLQRVCAE